MSKRPRRNHQPAFKAKVAFAANKNDKTLAELSQQFDVQSDVKRKILRKLAAQHKAHPQTTSVTVELHQAARYLEQ